MGSELCHIQKCDCKKYNVPYIQIDYILIDKRRNSNVLDGHSGHQILMAVIKQHFIDFIWRGSISGN
jgi:hypothetical protein